jgi:hypothetical protein
VATPKGVLVKAGRTAKAVLVHQVLRLRLATRAHQPRFYQDRKPGTVPLRYMAAPLGTGIRYSKEFSKREAEGRPQAGRGHSAGKACPWGRR